MSVILVNSSALVPACAWFSFALLSATARSTTQHVLASFGVLDTRSEQLQSPGSLLRSSTVQLRQDLKYLLPFVNDSVLSSTKMFSAAT